jgi:tyrosyl-tRNA synthetase
VARFSNRQLPEDLPQVTLAAPEGLMIGLALQRASLAGTTSEALRLIGQGAVRVDGVRVEDPKRLLAPAAEYVVQVGRRRASLIKLI